MYQYTTNKEGLQVPYYKECPRCHAHLDPGERCSCDGYEQPEIEMAQRPKTKNLPRRDQSGIDEYIARVWREFDMR